MLTQLYYKYLHTLLFICCRSLSFVLALRLFAEIWCGFVWSHRFVWRRRCVMIWATDVFTSVRFSLPIFDILIQNKKILREDFRYLRCVYILAAHGRIGVVLFRYFASLFFIVYAVIENKPLTSLVQIFLFFIYDACMTLMPSKHFAMWIYEFWNINIVAIFTINYTCMCYFFSPFRNNLREKKKETTKSNSTILCSSFICSEIILQTLVSFYWECARSKFRLFRIQSIFNGLIKINWIYLLSQARKKHTHTHTPAPQKLLTLFSLLLQTLLFCANKNINTHTFHAFKSSVCIGRRYSNEKKITEHYNNYYYFIVLKN